VIKAKSTVKWTTGETLPRRVATILTEYGKALDQQFKEQIKLVQFPWPGVTYRRNGTIEGSPRDIVDTGAFLRSQVRTRLDATNLRFSWGNASVPYAGIIAQGKGPSYPARDWIKPAFDNVPLEQFFAGAWVRNGGSR
jgi:hypothetical protein